MKATALFIGLFSILCNYAEASDPNRLVTKNLPLNNGVDQGQWGEIEYCYDGSFVRDIEVMFEPYSILHLDETAINTVKLYCVTPDGSHTGYITSKIGEKGEWQGERLCPNGFMTGMRAKVLPFLGSEGEDVAVQNIEMTCNYGESSVLAVDETNLDPTKVDPGEWSDWTHCDDDSAICGLKVRYEKPFLVEDTVAVSDISMYCCSVFIPPIDENN